MKSLTLIYILLKRTKTYFHNRGVVVFGLLKKLHSSATGTYSGSSKTTASGNSSVIS